MITVYTWTEATHSCQHGGQELLPPRDNLPDVTWVDLANPTPEEEQLVFEQFFPIHSLTLEDVTRPRREPDQPPHFPKVEEFPDYLFVIVNPIHAQTAAAVFAGKSEANPQRMSRQLSAVLTQRLLLTHHYDSISAIAELHSHLKKHEVQVGRGPDYLFHLALDSVVDHYAPLLDGVDDLLDALETEIFTKPSGRLLARLLSLKRGVIGLRKTMVYEREVLARLTRGEFSLIDEREMVYYRNVYDHLIRFTDLIEASREMVMDLMQTLLASQANKLNEVMKVLTMISTTILPMTLIAGVYGMNFENSVWPDFKTAEYGFPLAIAAMLASAAASFGFFRWMKWI